MAAHSSNQYQLADLGLELIQELERNPDCIPPYNEELMKRCAERIKFLFTQNVDDVQNQKLQQSLNESADASSGSANTSLSRQSGGTETIMVRHAAIERLKRCMLAYVHHRQLKLKRCRWDYGGMLPLDIRSKLCDAEVQWFLDYSSNLAAYQAEIVRTEDDDVALGADLTSSMQPPKSLNLQVRCLEDYGEYETCEGISVFLKKDNIVSLPRQDGEQLIKQGVLSLAG